MADAQTLKERVRESCSPSAGPPGDLAWVTILGWRPAQTPRLSLGGKPPDSLAGIASASQRSWVQVLLRWLPLSSWWCSLTSWENLRHLPRRESSRLMRQSLCTPRSQAAPCGLGWVRTLPHPTRAPSSIARRGWRCRTLPAGWAPLLKEILTLVSLSRLKARNWGTRTCQLWASTEVLRHQRNSHLTKMNRVVFYWENVPDRNNPALEGLEFEFELHGFVTWDSLLLGKPP